MTMRYHRDRVRSAGAAEWGELVLKSAVVLAAAMVLLYLSGLIQG